MYEQKFANYCNKFANGRVRVVPATVFIDGKFTDGFRVKLAGEYIEPNGVSFFLYREAAREAGQDFKKKCQVLMR